MRYYIFRGNGKCGKCKANSGVYSVRPSRPHPNCRCEIVEIDDGDCGNFRYQGKHWGPPHNAPVKDLGNGLEAWQIEVEVTKRDGSVERRTIEIQLPSDMPFAHKMMVIGDAAEDAAEDIEDCPPPLVA
jgi:hypothetical protein